MREAGLPGILGDKHASGTDIIDELGEEHIRTGKPICYTSVDCVFQIAAHEETFGLERLYEICLHGPPPLRSAEDRPRHRPAFRRRRRRRASRAPATARTSPCRRPADTSSTGCRRRGRRGGQHRQDRRHLRPSRHRPRDQAARQRRCLTAALEALRALPDGDFVFANFVDFDTDFGHRRDVPGYAAALEAFDRRLPEIQARAAREAISPSSPPTTATIRPGAAPTTRASTCRSWPSARQVAPGPMGRRDTFADIAATIAAHLGVEIGAGRPFLPVGRPKRRSLQSAASS